MNHVVPVSGGKDSTATAQDDALMKGATRHELRLMRERFDLNGVGLAMMILALGILVAGVIVALVTIVRY